MGGNIMGGNTMGVPNQMNMGYNNVSQSGMMMGYPYNMMMGNNMGGGGYPNNNMQPVFNYPYLMTHNYMNTGASNTINPQQIFSNQYNPYQNTINPFVHPSQNINNNNINK
jgi:hypothetical protein